VGRSLSGAFPRSILPAAGLANDGGLVLWMGRDITRISVLEKLLRFLSMRFDRLTRGSNLSGGIAWCVRREGATVSEVRKITAIFDPYRRQAVMADRTWGALDRKSGHRQPLRANRLATKATSFVAEGARLSAVLQAFAISSAASSAFARANAPSSRSRSAQPTRPSCPCGRACRGSEC
jgi:hypothetical protein